MLYTKIKRVNPKSSPHKENIFSSSVLYLWDDVHWTYVGIISGWICHYIAHLKLIKCCISTTS